MDARPAIPMFCWGLPTLWWRQVFCEIWNEDYSGRNDFRYFSTFSKRRQKNVQMFMLVRSRLKIEKSFLEYIFHDILNVQDKKNVKYLLLRRVSSLFFFRAPQITTSFQFFKSWYWWLNVIICFQSRPFATSSRDSPFPWFSLIQLQ